MSLQDHTGLWAIRSEAGEELGHQLDRFVASATPEQMAAFFARKGQQSGPEPLAYDVQGNGVAVISIEGALSKKPMFDFWSGSQMGTTYGQILSGVQAAQNDASVRAVVLAWDSPGGTVDGAQEASDALFAMRATGKPMESVACGQMCSAAEMVGSATGTVWAANDTTDMGSIGVLAIHRDFSALEEKLGIKTTLLTAGKYKGAGFGPLDMESKAILQDGLNHSYDIFKQTVARNRGISLEAVDAMAEGRVFKGQKAVQVGLAKGIATVAQRVSALSKTPSNQVRPFALATAPNHKEKNRMTKEELLAQFPELAESFRAEGRAEGQTHGAESERNRIKAVLEQSTPGHEALVKEKAFDGKSTAGDVALAILTAQREKREEQAKNLQSDTPAPVRTPAQASVADKTEDEESEKPKLSGVAIANKMQRTIQEHAARGVTLSAQEALQIIRKEQA